MSGGSRAPRSFVDSGIRGSAHAAFQEWREKNPDGIFLHRRTKRKAMLHRVNCGHVENPARELSPDWNLTGKEKICAPDRASLEEWAAREGVDLLTCRDCEPI